MRWIRNVVHLGRKELISLRRDPVMLIFVIYGFTVMIYVMANGISLELRNASVAVADEDHSTLSRRIRDALLAPYFRPPDLIFPDQIDEVMNRGLHTFVIDIPPDFQADVVAGRRPAVQLNIDATAMSQAGIGRGYLQRILRDEVREFVAPGRGGWELPVGAVIRAQFNPNMVSTWFMGINGLTMVVSLLAVLLTGAAVIREREHGTLEHLLVMPLRPSELMVAKVGANSLIVLLAASLSLIFVVRGLIGAPLAGSMALFLIGVALNLFAMTSIGIALATLVRSMPQFGLVTMLVVMPMNILSGGTTPLESMPEFIQYITFISPTTHFVKISQAILFRGAGFEGVWLEFLAVASIAIVFFSLALSRFRASVATA